jgi:ATP-binding protein involved in chromosome partitioning
VAISVGHLLPNAELLVVTTPQLAAAEVAERAGALAPQLHQHVAGVIENMSYLPCPHCGERIELYGSGGGQAVADELTKIIGARVPLLGQIPQEIALREGSDAGVPLVLSNPGSAAATELTAIAAQLANRTRGLAGRRLNLSPV